MPDNEIKNEIVEGRNAVIEALRAGRAIDKIFIAKGDVDKTLGHIASKARDKGIVVVECDRKKLDFMSQTHAHQGVIALCAVREYCTVEDIFAVAEERGEKPFIIVCDGIHQRGVCLFAVLAVSLQSLGLLEGDGGDLIDGDASAEDDVLSCVERCSVDELDVSVDRGLQLGVLGLDEPDGE